MEEERNCGLRERTVVKGIRAKPSFFDKCDLVAKSENCTRNELVVRFVSDYLDRKDKEDING